MEKKLNHLGLVNGHANVCDAVHDGKISRMTAHSRSWNINRLLVAAIAMMFSVGCHVECKIFFVKSKQSTLISSFLRLAPVLTFRGFNTDRGLITLFDASSVKSRFRFRPNIRKKLLYDPVKISLSFGLQQHSNLSKIQSFSYSEHKLGYRNS